MSKILVTGATGQLAKCIKDVFSECADTLSVVYRTSSELDITDVATVFQEFKTTTYDYCINTAAYTHVDGAETNQETARSVNSEGAKHLAAACAKNNVVLIHISTDFVFDGSQSVPYIEEDATHALGVYGATKLEGEKTIRSLCPKHFIIRTSWLYSEYGSNFLKSMLEYGREEESLSIVFDQVGSPTYARDLAQILSLFVVREIDDYGTYHFSNEGVASWYDFAQAIFEINNISVRLLPIRSEAYPLPAQRPHFSVLDKSKIKKVLQIEIPHWRDSLLRASETLALKSKKST
ncbi:dTDP-4-dehydrorhamnose reductase [Pareuzebyella sediminis]|uniref:dTDP-4-dehydrorhamnose reductase n=1 Tax=Pareuzebyella sediminis TaxID=2607998 RepID=UPI0011ED21C4|nr:dTDP-4-dehydrorhamnose reductase [Pareuzebyella sediminis]